MESIYFDLYKSDKPSKKLMVIDEDDHKIYFGATGYEDFTIHKDEERKERYIARHVSREDWDDLGRAGTWALYILWNKKTISASIRDMQKEFHIKIINHL